MNAIQLFPFLAVVALVAAAASRLPGFRVSDAIVPEFDTDTYPTHYATYGKGGLRTVADTSQLAQITTLRREPGMLVYVTNQANFYKLSQDLTTWTIWTVDNTNAITDGDKGDISVASGVWTIDSGVVSTGKLSTGAVAWVEGHLTEAEASAIYQGTNAALSLLQSGNGTGLTSLDGSAVTTGTVEAARIDSTIATDAEVAAGYEPLNANKYQGTNGNLTTVASLTGGNPSNFYRGTGGFAQVTTNDVPGLVADILAASASGSDIDTNNFAVSNFVVNGTATINGSLNAAAMVVTNIDATSITGDGSGITGIQASNVVVATTPTNVSPASTSQEDFNVAVDAALGSISGSIAYDIDVSAQTTDSSSVAIATNGVAADTTILLELNVAAAGPTNAGGYKLSAVFANQGGSIAVSNVQKTVALETDAGLDVNLIHYGTNVVTEATGLTDEEINWIAKGLVWSVQNGAATVNPFSGLVSVTDLVAYWRLDETSGNRVDLIGTNDLVKESTGDSYVAGQITNALYVSSAADQYAAYDSDEISLGTDTPFSINLWVNPRGYNTWTPLVCKGTGAGATTIEWWTALNSTGSVYFFVANGASSASRTTTATIASNGWTMLTFTHDTNANTINIYTNQGGLLGTQSWSGGTTNGTGKIRVGMFPHTDASYANAYIDEVGFWKRVLSASDISNLWNTGTGRAY